MGFGPWKESQSAKVDFAAGAQGVPGLLGPKNSTPPVDRRPPFARRVRVRSRYGMAHGDEVKPIKIALRSVHDIVNDVKVVHLV
jgi:hypothetical protein